MSEARQSGFLSGHPWRYKKGSHPAALGFMFSLLFVLEEENDQ